MKTNDELIKESIIQASKILILAFSLADCKTHIEGVVDYGYFGKFQLKFSKLEDEKNEK